MNSPSSFQIIPLSKKVEFQGLDWRNRLLGKEGYHTGFVMNSGRVEAKNQTRFAVFRHQGEITICCLLLQYNRDGINGNGPDYRDGYQGSISLAFGLKGDGTDLITFGFTEAGPPSVRRRTLTDDTRSTDWPLPRAIRWQFDTRFRSSGLFESKQTYFQAVFLEDDLFSRSPVIGFNIHRVDALARELSVWNLAEEGTLIRSPRFVPCPARTPGVRPSKRHLISVTSDPLMVMKPCPYTPELLDSELAMLRDWGVDRFHWIDNTGYPAPGQHHYRQSVKNCGDLLAAVAKASRRHGVELIADFKLYDISYLVEPRDSGARKAHPMFDGSFCLPFMDEMLKTPDIYMSTQPEWVADPALPVHVMRFYSLDPIHRPKAEEFLIEQSGDNVNYAPVDLAGLNVRVRKVQRPNLTFHPAGVEETEGRHPCWMLELTGVEITEPFISIRMSGNPVTIFHQQFAAFEAVGSDGQNAAFVFGQPVSGPMPFEVATVEGQRRYSFSAAGMISGGEEPMVALSKWSLANLGISLRQPRSIPGMIEPACEAGAAVWLSRLEYLLSQDIEGVSLRTLRHHRGCHSWTRYSYHPEVVAAFKRAYGRGPTGEVSELDKIREIRGQAYTRFIESASGRVRNAGKKLIFQLEMIVGDLRRFDSQMGFYFHLEDWIKRELIDEIHVRPFSGHHQWLRNVLLPFCRRHGVGVTLVTANESTGYGADGYLQNIQIVKDSISAGYQGVNFYETANLYESLDSKTFTSRGFGERSVRDAAFLSRQLLANPKSH